MSVQRPCAYWRRAGIGAAASKGKSGGSAETRGRADRIRIGSNDGIPCRRRGSPDRMAKSDGIEKENGAFRIKTERMNRANKKPVGGRMDRIGK